MNILAKGGGVREHSVPPPVTQGALVCPRCGATNAPATPRCRSCLTPLTSPPKRAPRAVTLVVDQRKQEFDAMLWELEALTRDEAPPLRYQCPVCSSEVDESATRCRCGAVFGETGGIVGYQCPLCGTRVTAEASRCRCGAIFSA